MAVVLDIVSWGLLALGSFMLMTGGLGLIRLPDVFSRMHAAGIIDTLGASAIMAGLMFQAGLSIVTVKLGLIIIFIMFTGPTATHALARAAGQGGAAPQLDKPEKKNKKRQEEGKASSKT
ncbi:MAG: monovalent cation/H(+) antiporter subunit G [Alphaproteobacteria bacterium]|nr:monovalent cation/H(+) antiporter subunit G [Alphaproteobacteria bacterium]